MCSCSKAILLPLKCEVELTKSGWQVLRLRGSGFFVNQTFAKSKSPLQSGDIVRLSHSGPDFQFYLQGGASRIDHLAKEILATSTDKAIPSTDKAIPSSEALQAAEEPAPAKSQPPPVPSKQSVGRQTQVLDRDKLANPGEAKRKTKILNKKQLMDWRIPPEEEANESSEPQNRSNQNLFLAAFLLIAILAVLGMLAGLAYLLGGGNNESTNARETNSVCLTSTFEVI